MMRSSRGPNIIAKFPVFHHLVPTTRPPALINIELTVTLYLNFVLIRETC